MQQGRRYTIDQIIEIGCKYGFIIEKDIVYKNANVPFKCSCIYHPDKFFKKCLKSIMCGQRCPYCARESKVAETIDDVRVYLANLDYILESKNYIDQSHTIEYRCLKHPDKLLTTTFGSIKSGHGCAYCAKNASYTLEEAVEYFTKLHLKLLATEVPNVYSKLPYICEIHSDEIRYTTLSQVVHGHGCRLCGRDATKGEKHHNWNGGITNLDDYLRNHLNHINWIKSAFIEQSRQCYISGKREKTNVVHHSVNFALLRDNMLEELNLNKRKQMTDYSDDEIKLMVAKMQQYHDSVKGIVMDVHIHKLFHSIYGLYNNSLKQVEEFKNRYDAGEFNEILSNVKSIKPKIKIKKERLLQPELICRKCNKKFKREHITTVNIHHNYCNDCLPKKYKGGT